MYKNINALMPTSSTTNSGLTKGEQQVTKCSKWECSTDWQSQTGMAFVQNWA